LESGIHLGGAAVSVWENDVSVTVDCGAVVADTAAVQLGHVENRRFFMPADHPSISKNTPPQPPHPTPPFSEFVVSLVARRRISKRAEKKSYTDVDYRMYRCINNTLLCTYVTV